ncbi:hypothetical protein O181_040504 [Austropuccinia psidii MF-1]|uniref:Uncharacterized protein n=1 Tax=Austropuccinia psidii MF-1 TaxID=1389203 RepID=A0A9Q3DCK1_9BASI|nr:hypothetical protein [Austropuccinia psidii MF-1]
MGHKSVHGLWKPSEATRSAPSKDSPPAQAKTSFSSMPSILKDQEWCIYGIIYHYAPFPLSHPMVKLSGPNYVIPNQVPGPSAISKKDFSAIQSCNSLAATRRPFEDPNHLALQRLGCHFLISTNLRAILRGYQYFQSLSRHQVFSIPWKPNWSIQEVIKHPVWPWPNSANSYSTVVIQSHRSILKMVRTILAQFQQYSRMIHLPGSAFQLFTYTGHLSSPGVFFPS